MAIALQAGSPTDGGNNSGASGSLTFAVNVGAGSDRILFVGFAGAKGNESLDDVTGVTYAGAAMTLVGKRVTAASDLRNCYLYVLVNPASGTNNVVISCSNTHYLLGGAVSYTGAAQSGQPDATNTNSTTGTSLTTSVTTVANNCWTVLVNTGFASSNAPAEGTGSTRRTYEGSFGAWGLFDSNAVITPAGSYSMQTTYPAAGDGINHVMASFSPSGGGGGGPAPTTYPGADGCGVFYRSESGLMLPDRSSAHELLRAA